MTADRVGIFDGHALLITLVPYQIAIRCEVAFSCFRRELSSRAFIEIAIIVYYSLVALVSVADMSVIFSITTCCKSVFTEEYGYFVGFVVDFIVILTINSLPYLMKTTKDIFATIGRYSFKIVQYIGIRLNVFRSIVETKCDSEAFSCAHEYVGHYPLVSRMLSSIHS